jgi:hypothetical protein
VPPGDQTGIELVRLDKLEKAPVGVGSDRTWWEAELASDDAHQTIMLWATGANAERLTEQGIRDEVERLAQSQPDLQSIYDASPIELLPPSR